MSLDIAIIGMAGRFPGANDIGAFWTNLCAGVESVSRLDDAQLLAAGVDPVLLARPDYIRARALLDAIDQFDASLFGVSPAEAAALDPQHRVLLECAWQAFEHAGYVPERVGRPVGVFAGAGQNGYHASAARLESAADLAATLAGGPDFLTTRISYKLGLEGPSVAVQTACSTSLVAVHLACQSLLVGECDLALAGGVSIAVPQAVGYVYQPGAIASPDGHCRAFDAAAQGTIGGSGAALILLKRLDDALADRDSIIAVIKGSAINNDGRMKVGFTAPRVDGQARVIRDAHLAAGIDAATIGYVEAHGTGTPLGDPIEVAALAQAFRATTDRNGFCALGSVKTNIGHLDAAAGIAGLVKGALAVAHGRIPPTLHVHTPHPAIDFDASPFRLATELVDWPRDRGPRRAGVSSFGLGGTNAHVVLEEAPPIAADATTGPYLLACSARSRASLDRLCDELASRIEESSIELADVAFTLAHGRRAFPYRRAVVCVSAEDATRALRGSCEDAPASARVVAFLFPGQGAQQAGMARELYDTEPVFRAEIDRAAARLRGELDLHALLLGAAGDLDHTSRTQPALFVFELALARLWMSWGVTPAAMAGHSLGEYVAACIAGCIDVDDALALVAARGRLMESIEPGAMLAVAASETEVAQWLGADVALAAVNSPRQCVLSGTPHAIDDCERELAASAIRARRIRTTRAFHSHLMDPILAAFGEVVSRVRLHAPQIPWVSNVTGTWITDADAQDPAYWVRHLREPVRFTGAATTLSAEPTRLLLELGPGHTLAGLCQQHAGAPERLALSATPDGSREALLDAVGRVWTAGAPVDLARVLRQPRRRVALPTTPFERERHWIEPVAATPGHGSLYIPSWKRAPVPARVPASDSHWLVLADDDTFGDAIVARLGELGRAVTRVRTGAAFGRTRDGFTLRAGEPEDHDALVRALDPVPTAVVHAWSLSSIIPSSPCTAAQFRAAQARGAASLAWLVRAIARTPGERTITVVTGALHDVTGREALRPEHATLLGMARTVVLEHPGLACRVIDLDPSEPIDVDRILGEQRDLLVAYRGGHRWLPTVEPIALDATPDRPAALRERGVYLITGGLGGVGLAIAEELARTVRARLVLVGRSAANSARLDTLRALGGEVLVLAADVTDAPRMRQVVADTIDRFGALHGVVHAAGVAAGALIERLTPAVLEDDLAAKAIGALVLDEVLADVDFVLHTSSLTGLSGGIGRAGYAAANAFLDAHAHATARYTVAVDFDRWRSIGMAARAEARLRDAGLDSAMPGGLTVEDGQQLLRQILAQTELRQVIVSQRPLRGMPVDEDSVALARSLGIAPGPAKRPELRQAPLDVRRELAAIWARAFGLEHVADDADFFALGGESLLALQILNRVRDTFGVDVPIRELFRRPTVAGLAELVIGASPPDAEPALVAVPRTTRRLNREDR